MRLPRPREVPTGQRPPEARRPHSTARAGAFGQRASELPVSTPCNWAVSFVDLRKADLSLNSETTEPQTAGNRHVE